MIFDIRDRTRKFAVRIIKLVKNLPNDTSGREIGRQLLRAGTSIGANLEEADGASTRKDFFHKVSIAYKEARESEYWLALILESKLFNNPRNVKEAESLRKEAIELSKILFSITDGKNNKKINMSPKATPCS